MNRFLNVTFDGVSLKRPEWRGPTWFNLGVGGFALGILIPGRFYRSVPVWLYNAFRHDYDDPQHDCWGLGLLQVGSRHLLGVVSNEEKFQVDVLFMHVVERRPETDLPGGEKR